MLICAKIIVENASNVAKRNCFFIVITIFLFVLVFYEFDYLYSYLQQISTLA